MRHPLFALILGLLTLIPGSFAGEQQGREPLLSAKGRTGPVGLKLTLLRNKIKVGESLFVKTTLTNFSKEPLTVSEWIYLGSDDLGRVWSDETCNRLDPAIEVRDSKGHRLKPNPHVGRYGSDSPFDQTVGQLDAETLRHIKTLESQGLNDAQITRRLREEQIERQETSRRAKYPAIHLKHGQSVESVAWCSKNNATACPGNGFVELTTYLFEHPGHYRIRAVRDARPSEEFKKWSDKWDIRTATDWITFEVSR